MNSARQDIQTRLREVLDLIASLQPDIEPDDELLLIAVTSWLNSHARIANRTRMHALGERVLLLCDDELLGRKHLKALELLRGALISASNEMDVDEVDRRLHVALSSLEEARRSDSAAGLTLEIERLLQLRLREGIDAPAPLGAPAGASESAHSTTSAIIPEPAAFQGASNSLADCPVEEAAQPEPPPNATEAGAYPHATTTGHFPSFDADVLNGSQEGNQRSPVGGPRGRVVHGPFRPPPTGILGLLTTSGMHLGGEAKKVQPEARPRHPVGAGPDCDASGEDSTSLSLEVETPAATDPQSFDEGNATPVTPLGAAAAPERAEHDEQNVKLQEKRPPSAVLLPVGISAAGQRVPDVPPGAAALQPTEPAEHASVIPSPPQKATPVNMHPDTVGGTGNHRGRAANPVAAGHAASPSSFSSGLNVPSVGPSTRVREREPTLPALHQATSIAAYCVSGVQSTLPATEPTEPLDDAWCTLRKAFERQLYGRKYDAARLVAHVLTDRLGPPPHDDPVSQRYLRPGLVRAWALSDHRAVEAVAQTQVNELVSGQPTPYELLVAGSIIVRAALEVGALLVPAETWELLCDGAEQGQSPEHVIVPLLRGTADFIVRGGVLPASGNPQDNRDTERELRNHIEHMRMARYQNKACARVWRNLADGLVTIAEQVLALKERPGRELRHKVESIDISGELDEHEIQGNYRSNMKKLAETLRELALDHMKRMESKTIAKPGRAQVDLRAQFFATMSGPWQVFCASRSLCCPICVLAFAPIERRLSAFLRPEEAH